MKKDNKAFKLSTKWMAEHYSKFNDEIFDGVLPRITFSLSNAAGHSGWARYKKNFITMKITPMKILMSTYLNPTESIAINTLLHEMIHIADYTLHPEHFFDEFYDCHESSFFQYWMNELNNMGYHITVNVTDEEIEVAKSEASKKNKGKNAIAILARWYGDKERYDIGWTEMQYLSNVIQKNSYTHYQSIMFCDIIDNDFLNAKECKGKLMRGNYISECVTKEMLQNYAGKIKFPGFKNVNVANRILSFKEKFGLICNEYHIKQSIISKIQKMFEYSNLQRHINKEGSFSLSSDIMYVDGKEYWVLISEGFKDTCVRNYKKTTMIYMPIKPDTMRKLKEEYNKMLDGECYFPSKFENDIEEEIENGLRSIKTVEDILEESNHKKIDVYMIVEEIVRKIMHKAAKRMDKSIVDVKKLEDGSEIITQW